jgi:hypothetical protein
MAGLVELSRSLERDYVTFLGTPGPCKLGTGEAAFDCPVPILLAAASLLEFGKAVTVFRGGQAEFEAGEGALATVADFKQPIEVFAKYAVVQRHKKEMKAANQRLDRCVEAGLCIVVQAAAALGDRLAGQHRTIVEGIDRAASSQALANVEMLFDADVFPGDRVPEIQACVKHQDTCRVYGGFKEVDAVQQRIAEVAPDIERLQAAAAGPEWQQVVAAWKAALAPFEEQDSVARLTRAGRKLGNMTAMQALTRELTPGETRSALCRRLLVGLSRKAYLTVDPKLHMALQKSRGL